MAQHSYTFSIFRNTPFMSHCVFQYKNETVIPNPVIEKIARNILTHATQLWLQGHEQCLDTELNLETLKTVLNGQNDQELLEWLEPYRSLLIHNDHVCMASNITTVVIKLE